MPALTNKMWNEVTTRLYLLILLNYINNYTQSICVLYIEYIVLYHGFLIVGKKTQPYIYIYIPTKEKLTRLYKYNGYMYDMERQQKKRKNLLFICLLSKQESPLLPYCLFWN